MNLDPETVMKGVDIYVQVVGLLSAWKQDRAAVDGEHFQNFMIWLENHNFHALTERIYQSEELQRNLHEILAGTLEKIDHRLDVLATAVAEVSLKIDGLRDIGRAISTDTGGLSRMARD